MSGVAPDMAGAVRLRLPVLPHRRLGWVTFMVLLAICLVPAWWATVDDLLPTSGVGDLGMLVIAIAVPTSGFLLSREAIFRRKDPAILLTLAFAAATVAVAIGMMVALAMLGLAVFGD